ncbi:MAG: DUF969 domain-containing protein [Peptostreptococcaceae bacterium]
MIKLIGILIVVFGFLFKVETLFTILLAGICTGLVSGLSTNEILTIIGDSFISNRAVSLFMITLPVIGILERYGLRQRAVFLIQKIEKLTTGLIFTMYMFIRQIAGLLSIRMSGHPQFVRPIINPMAQAAGGKNLDGEDIESIKALSAASENYGNFFGQNLFAGSSGVLLIASTLNELGYTVSAIDIAKSSIIMAFIALTVVFIQSRMFDFKLQNKMKRLEEEKI